MVSFMYACTTCLKNAPDKPHRDDRNVPRKIAKKPPEKPRSFRGPSQRAPERPLFGTLDDAKNVSFPVALQQKWKPVIARTGSALEE